MELLTITGRKSQIVDYFNAGGHIWANTSANVPGYYEAFLPPNLLSTTAPLSTSSGFYATPEGVAIGLTNVMLNGDQTHNTFTDVPSVFTVFERLSTVSGVQNSSDRIISIGLRDGIITGGGGAGGGIVTGSTAVPEPFKIVGTMLGGAAALRMRKRLKATNKV